MKTIGLIGGMSWESTIPYYRIINETMRARLGQLHSAQCVLWSFDFQAIEELQHLGDWDELTRMMQDAAKSIERAGADFTVICTNTMHKMAEQVEAVTEIPLLHIADVTATAIQAAGIKKVGLLATRFTMGARLLQGSASGETRARGPDSRQRRPETGSRCESTTNSVPASSSPESRRQFRAIIRRLTDAGAEGVILGCTEIGLLVQPEDCPVALFDTTPIHAMAAVDYALS